MAPVVPRGVFQKRRSDRYTRDFVAHEVPSFKNFWKAATRDPKAPQGGAKATPKEAKGTPKTPKANQKDKIYISNSRSTVPADVML